jgi:Flp pilus assembly pilin Flp
MNQLMAFVRNLAAKEDGQDLMEYGLLVVLIALVAIATVTAFGIQLNTVFWETIANNF